jgi:hypothetical protein
MKNKSNKILGIISIIWGAILFIYQILRNTILSDLYSDIYMKQLLTVGQEGADKFKLLFDYLYTTFEISFFVSLIIISIIVIIINKKQNIKLFSKETTNNGTLYILLGLLIYILLGWNLISVIIVPIGGYLFYKQ